jgi:hypothetical protein
LFNERPIVLSVPEILANLLLTLQALPILSMTLSSRLSTPSTCRASSTKPIDTPEGDEADEGYTVIREAMKQIRKVAVRPLLSG